ncbi:spexin prohormone 2 isoform X2 [Tachysurus fulvidraco]|uniref:spexin prohormone 2 isoform X2 n=1 Tax=Tachysurus fulvidraco TaxID=1234273 RepID=UPI000F4E2DDC|nr:spexin prohormone 2 isoform X2 [Tachysurus fulvidraco]
MEEGSVFPGPEYCCGEDLSRISMVPLSFAYTPFSIQIPNNYSNVNHLTSFHHQHGSEAEQTCPSVWDHDFNTHGFSCPLCCDPSSSHLSPSSPMCCSDGLLPLTSLYKYQSPMTASHAWTPFRYHTSTAELCDTVSSITSEEEQIFSTHESNSHCNQMDLGHSVQPTFCPVPPDIETVGQNKDSIRSFSENSKKPCHCTKSKCLKLYCDCFANGETCSECSCINCCNNTEHATDRHRAIMICLDRNPDAFRSKFNSSIQGVTKRSHSRGCNCKSSGCLKNYCECYKAQIMCSSMCKCVSCSNYGTSEVEKQSTVETSTHTHNNTTQCTANLSCLTDAAVEATCGCLLAQAEEVEKDGLSRVQAERVTLEEFGYCLTQIVHFMFKHTQLEL